MLSVTCICKHIYVYTHTYLYIHMYIFNSTSQKKKNTMLLQKIWFLGKVSIGHILDVHTNW